MALCFRCSAAKDADPAVTLASVKVLGLSGDVTVMSNAAGLPNIQSGPEHQQVVYDVGHAQDHSLLQHGHQCRFACRSPETHLEACCGGRLHHPCTCILMHDDPRGQDSVRNRMDIWHLERNQYLSQEKISRSH